MKDLAVIELEKKIHNLSYNDFMEEETQKKLQELLAKCSIITSSINSSAEETQKYQSIVDVINSEIAFRKDHNISNSSDSVRKV